MHNILNYEAAVVGLQQQKTAPVWSDESLFLLKHSNVWVRIWLESTDPSCLISVIQAAGGVMLFGIFSWHTLSLLVLPEHCLNATAY